MMSLISTNQTIHHPQIGDFYWMTVSVNFLIKFNMVQYIQLQFTSGMTATFPHANEFLGRNRIEHQCAKLHSVICMRTLLAELFMGWVHPWVGLGGDVTARSQLSANTVESAEPLKWGLNAGLL